MPQQSTNRHPVDFAPSFDEDKSAIMTSQQYKNPLLQPYVFQDSPSNDSLSDFLDNSSDPEPMIASPPKITIQNNISNASPQKPPRPTPKKTDGESPISVMESIPETSTESSFMKPKNLESRFVGAAESASNCLADDASLDDPKDDANDPTTELDYDVIVNQLLQNDPELQQLKVSKDFLQKHSVSLVANGIQNSKTLMKLVVDFKGFDSADDFEVFKTLVSSWKNQNSIVSLEIHNADIDRKWGMILGHALSLNKTLKRFCVQECSFDSDSAFAILMTGLQHCKAVIQLHIESVPLGFSQADIVSACLPLMNLRQLCLINTGMNFESIKFLYQTIAMTPTLIDLDLSRNFMNLESVQGLMSTLMHSKVQRLSLAECGLDAATVQAFPNGLAKGRTKVKKLDLSFNVFGNKGIAALHVLLRENNSIRELKVDQCGISSKELAKLNDTLRYNNTFLKKILNQKIAVSILESVELMGNGIKDKAESSEFFKCGSGEADLLNTTLEAEDQKDIGALKVKTEEA